MEGTDALQREQARLRLLEELSSVLFQTNSRQRGLRHYAQPLGDAALDTKGKSVAAQLRAKKVEILEQERARLRRETEAELQALQWEARDKKEERAKQAYAMALSEMRETLRKKEAEARDLLAQRDHKLLTEELYEDMAILYHKERETTMDTLGRSLDQGVQHSLLTLREEVQAELLQQRTGEHRQGRAALEAAREQLQQQLRSEAQASLSELCRRREEELAGEVEHTRTTLREQTAKLLRDKEEVFLEESRALEAGLRQQLQREYEMALEGTEEIGGEGGREERPRGGEGGEGAGRSGSSRSNSGSHIDSGEGKSDRMVKELAVRLNEELETQRKQSSAEVERFTLGLQQRHEHTLQHLRALLAKCQVPLAVRQEEETEGDPAAALETLQKKVREGLEGLRSRSAQLQSHIHEAEASLPAS